MTQLSFFFELENSSNQTNLIQNRNINKWRIPLWWLVNGMGYHIGDRIPDRGDGIPDRWDGIPDKWDGIPDREMGYQIGAPHPMPPSPQPHPLQKKSHETTPFPPIRYSTSHQKTRINCLQWVACGLVRVFTQPVTTMISLSCCINGPYTCLRTL